jgi:hypothetical protein
MSSGEAAIPTVSIILGEASWRFRKVRYYAGDCTSTRQADIPHVRERLVARDSVGAG